MSLIKEETEVKKDKEWAIKEAKETINGFFDRSSRGVAQHYEDELIASIADIINQLDEPKPKNITLQDVTDRLWKLPLNDRKLWLARLNNEFQEGYIVPLGLRTTDGEEQYLTYNGSYFASRRNRRLQQTFATLEEIPEFYRGLAEKVL